MKHWSKLIFIVSCFFFLRIQTYAHTSEDVKTFLDQHNMVMLVIHPENGTIIDANEAAASFYGYSLSELTSMNIADINTLSLEEIAIEREKALNEERNFFIFKHRLADNSIKDVHVYSYPILINGETYLSSVIIDQTQLIQTQNNFTLLIILFVIFFSFTTLMGMLGLLFMKRKNTLLKESEQRFKILHNASFSGIVIHDQGKILDCNDKLCDMTGYHRDELIGMDGLLLIALEYRDLVKHKIASGDEKAYEVFGLRKDHSIYPLKLEAKLIPYKGKQVRITEFKDLTHDLEEEKQFKIIEMNHQKLVNELPIGLVYHELIMNDEGHPVDYRFLDMNDSYEAITGLKKELVLNKTVKEVIPNVEETWIKRYGEVALTGISQRFEEYSQPLDKYFDVTAYSPQFGYFAVLVDDITEKKQRELAITHVSKHDFLTGLPNRRYGDEQLHHLDTPANYPLLVSIIDMDGLKLVNDAYGHHMGDLAIQMVAQALKQHCRPQDFVARIGGDEFLMLCPNTTLDEYAQTQESIKTYLRQDQQYEFPISLSFGSDIKVSLEESMDKLLIKAENDMYAHKVLHGQSSRNEAIMILFNSLIEKYEDERHHSQNVSSYCRAVGEHLLLSGDELKELKIAGMMHDIGKITIPDSILHKPDILTSQEWDIMKRHTVNGYQILKSADKYSRLAEYALTHHERWDGKGYPNHLKGEEIPLYSRIIAVCDAYEAMTSNRVYKTALSQEQAISELQRCALAQFDPLIVDIFVEKVLK